MTQFDQGDTPPSIQDVAIIVGGGPGISSSCARLFAENGMRVGIAARNPDKSVLQNLEKTHRVRRYACEFICQPAAPCVFASTPKISTKRRLARRIGAGGEVVLLGSIATGKYIDPLLAVLGERLRFPADFVGRGDMSRGGLLLRCARTGTELTYVGVRDIVRRGPRPPRLPPPVRVPPLVR